MIKKGMLNGLSLFSGYAGIDLALSEYVRPIIYCEIEKYAQAIILSRMDDGGIPFAPIWDDVTTLNGNLFNGLVDIVYAGFPCQDISVAGKGAGLEGKRSGLFYEIIRICKEASPQFIFLENVPNIRTNGSIEVQEALASIGYDSRWLTLSAAEIGAPHKRDRWFCLAHAKGIGASINESWVWGQYQGEDLQNGRDQLQEISNPIFSEKWWEGEPKLDRMVDGCPHRAHRTKALGNGVVPLQVKTAFKELMGIN